jgi:hypothetical protein
MDVLVIDEREEQYVQQRQLQQREETTKQTWRRIRRATFRVRIWSQDRPSRIRVCAIVVAAVKSKSLAKNKTKSLERKDAKLSSHPHNFKNRAGNKHTNVPETSVVPHPSTTMKFLAFSVLLLTTASQAFLAPANRTPSTHQIHVGTASETDTVVQVRTLVESIDGWRPSSFQGTGSWVSEKECSISFCCFVPFCF